MGQIVSVFSVGIRSVFLRYYQIIPKENSVGTFRYQNWGSGPLFPQKGGNGPLFEELQPPFGKKGGRKGGKYTKRGERYRPKYRKSSKSDTSKIPIPKKLLVTPRYTTLMFWAMISKKGGNTPWATD